MEVMSGHKYKKKNLKTLRVKNLCKYYQNHNKLCRKISEIEGKTN
jgi:hypothetical protein